MWIDIKAGERCDGCRAKFTGECPALKIVKTNRRYNEKFPQAAISVGLLAESASWDGGIDPDLAIAEQENVDTIAKEVGCSEPDKFLAQQYGIPLDDVNMVLNFRKS